MPACTSPRLAVGRTGRSRVPPPFKGATHAASVRFVFWASAYHADHHPLALPVHTAGGVRGIAANHPPDVLVPAAEPVLARVLDASIHQRVAGASFVSRPPTRLSEVTTVSDEKRAQFESGVGMALSALVSIPVLPADRKQLAVTIASASLGVGALAATRFVEALLDQLSEPVGEPTDYLVDEAA